MAIKTAAGTKLYTCALAQATPPVDATAYGLLTWVEITEVQNLGRFGDKSNIVQFTSLGDNRVRKIKGSRDAGTVALVMGRSPLDPGQTLLRVANGTTFDYAFKVAPVDKADANDTSSLYYWTGPVNGAEDEYGTVDNVVTLNTQLLINSDIVYTPAASVP